MKFFKSSKPQPIDVMNDMIAVIEKETMLCDFVEDSGRDIKYTFNPLITIKPPGDAFTLNPAAIPVIKDQANYYVNRVLIPVDIKRSELKKIMITMRSVYMGSKFGYNNRVTSASFQMPGYKLYCRLSEEHPNMYEIRYCAKGYPNED